MYKRSSNYSTMELGYKFPILQQEPAFILLEDYIIESVTSL